MASLGSLVIDLTASTARLQSDLGRGVGMLETFAKKAKTTLGVFGIGAGGGFLAGLAKDAIAFGDEIQKGAQRAGLAASTFSQLAAAAKQSDVDIGTLSKGLKNLQVQISTAAQSAEGEAATAFRQLGINLSTLKDATPDEQLKRVADALSRLQDPADRARLGTAALGKAYLDLVPLLDQGRQGITELVEEQKKLGNTFTDEQIKKLADTDDAIKRLSSSWHGLTTTITSEVAPALTKLFDALAGVEQKQYLLSRFGTSDEISDFATKGFLDKLLPEFTPTAKRLVGPAPDFAAMHKAEREQAQELERIRKAHIDDKVTDAGGIFAIDPADLEKTRGAYEGFLDAIKSSTDDSLTDITKRFDESTKDWSVFADQAARNITDSFADFFFDPFEDGLKGLFRSFVDTIRRMLAEAAAAKLGELLFGGKKDANGKTTTGLLSGLFGSLIGGARAGGGPVSAGRAYMVGERGPEWFVPGSNGAINANRGGGVTIQQHITLNGGSGDVAALLPAWGKQISDATVSRVLEISRRGGL